MEVEFVTILQKLINEQGKETLFNTAKCKALLSDYTHNEYKKECRLFLLALDAGVHKAIDTTKDIRICKLQQTRILHEEYFLEEEIAADVVDTLALVLLQEKTTPQQPAPKNMVLIKGGTFTMGSPANEYMRDKSEVQHQVTLSPFYMGINLVTQSEYQKVMGTNPSYFKGDNRPVEKVCLHDAIEYCNRLSQMEGSHPTYTVNKNNFEWDQVEWNQKGNGYRLPTEAEWEYACRAGTDTPFSTGNNITTEQANYNGSYPYNDNAIGIYRDETTSVGSFAPNPWGLYDMHGNVLEWCWDLYGNYPKGEQTDPKGATTGSFRVIRGGSWVSHAQSLRSAQRSYLPPTDGNFDIGFRLARSIQLKTNTA